MAGKAGILFTLVRSIFFCFTIRTFSNIPTPYIKIKIKIDTAPILFYKINLPVEYRYFYKKVWINYSDFSYFVAGCPLGANKNQGWPVAVI
jgi:hypothetical protein